jgi:hypothetical protein
VSVVSKGLKWPLIAVLMKHVVRRSIFLHFCAGSSFESFKKSVVYWEANFNVRCIPDQSTEDTIDKTNRIKKFENRLDMIKEIVSVGSNTNRIIFLPIKCSSLISPIILEILNSVLESEKRENTIYDRNFLLNHLSIENVKMLDEDMDRIVQLCNVHSKINSI